MSRIVEQSPHFSKQELQCPCCGQSKMDLDFIDKLEQLRAAFNAPMRLSSAYRCPAHNEQVSHTGKRGPHTTGKAVDVLVSGQNAHRLLTLALELGFTGIGISQKGEHGKRFVHLDMLEGQTRPWVWSY